MKAYLRRVARQLRVDPAHEGEILRELEAHLEDRVRDLEDQGLPREEAVRRALASVGEPQRLASAFTSVYSQASWGQAGLAALPHLLCTFFFLLHLWLVTPWVIILLGGATLLTVVAWRKGCPTWIYPWLGYALVAPVVSASLALGEVGSALWAVSRGERPPLPALAYVGMAVYILAVGVVVWALWVRVMRRDWLYASLTALPFPFLASWLLHVTAVGNTLDSEHLAAIDGATALVYGGLALATGAVYRLPQRALKVGTLAISLPVLAVWTAAAYGSSPLSARGLFLLLTGVAVLALPAWMDPWLGPPSRHRTV